jgi:hypothetical protein
VLIDHPFPRAGETILLRYSGVLAQYPRVGVHFGFNGWNQVDTTYALSMEEDGTDNQDYFAEVWMQAGSAEHLLELELPADARALHFVFFAEDGEQRVWDNNQGADYQLGIERPLIGPFLSYDDGVDPALQVRVNFHTGYPCVGAVEVGDSPSLGRHLEDLGPRLAHHFVIDQLQPNTEYYYRVSCDARPLSPVHHFHTIANDRDEARFVVLADAQAKGEVVRWPDVAQAVAAIDGLDFVVAAGDSAWNDRPGLWWCFFDEGRELFAQRPLVALLGNHDTPTVGSDPDSSSFLRYFGLNSAYRSLRIGPTAWLLYSTETPEDFIIDSGEQYVWTSTERSKLEGASWRFAALHIGPYGAGARHYAQQGDFRDLTTFFDGLVDWVFFGHEHLYQRHKPLRYNGILASGAEYGRDETRGVGYLLVPPAGAWPETSLIASDHEKAHYRERLAYPLLAAGEDQAPSENGYVLVNIDGRSIRLQTYGVGNHSSVLDEHLIDSIEYTLR